jgi:putative acetyltransferase
MPDAVIAIREERPDDVAAIRDVNDRAFDQPLEGRIVDALRDHGAVQLSLVAVVDDRVVGHILFSPVVTAATSPGSVVPSGLGPMAVVPEQQRRGIGAALIDAGLTRLRAEGCPFIVVLGHHEYYTRFGFVPASRHGLRCEWDVPDESFMVHVLDSASTTAAAGLVQYRPEFLMEMPG